MPQNDSGRRVCPCVCVSTCLRAGTHTKGPCSLKKAGVTGSPPANRRPLQHPGAPRPGLTDGQASARLMGWGWLGNLDMRNPLA